MIDDISGVKDYSTAYATAIKIPGIPVYGRLSLSEYTNKSSGFRFIGFTFIIAPLPLLSSTFSKNVES